MERFDIVDENGQPTGKTVSRDKAHSDGILHRTAHVWVLRQHDGHAQVLLQRRSECKDSFPGMFDTSSAGHVPAGDEPQESALRELKEELGISAVPADLAFAGTFRIQYEEVFHDSVFRDNEVTYVYVYRRPVSISSLTLQESEVSEVRWFDIEEVWEEIQTNRTRFCVAPEGLAVLRDYLDIGHNNRGD